MATHEATAFKSYLKVLGVWMTVDQAVFRTFSFSLPCVRLSVVFIKGWIHQNHSSHSLVMCGKQRADKPHQFTANPDHTFPPLTLLMQCLLNTVTSVSLFHCRALCSRSTCRRTGGFWQQKWSQCILCGPSHRWCRCTSYLRWSCRRETSWRSSSWARPRPARPRPPTSSR